MIAARGFAPTILRPDERIDNLPAELRPPPVLHAGVFPVQSILVIGASVRAAAASIRRAGAAPVAFDLFRDADLAAIANATRLEPAEYPRGIWPRVRHLEPMPWMFTGGLENHRAVVAILSTRFRFLGDQVAVARVRDPFWLQTVLRAADFLMPEIRRIHEPIPADGSWLVKPFASAGGVAINPWTGGPRPDPNLFYWQRRVAGLPLGATFVRHGTGTRLVGVTRQFVGRPGGPFAYRGSLGPWPVAAGVGRAIERLGDRVGRAAGLVGLFGIDLILDGNLAWPIEVNPRYTAAVEVLELALGRSILADHIRACDPSIPLRPSAIAPTAPVVGKAILFAAGPGRWVEPIGPATAHLADIPDPGTPFEAGEPVATVFGSGATITDCRRDLARRLRAWRVRIRSIPR